MIMLTLLFNIILVTVYILVKPYIDSVTIINNQTQPTEFQNLNDFLEKCLNVSILDCTLKPLTKPGDNFNSMLQALVVKFVNDSDIQTIQTQHLVIKTLNSNYVSARKSRQFLNEMHFYKDIVPTIRDFEQVANVPESERIDAFVQYFGSRLALYPNAEIVDSNAIILLENAKHRHFINLQQWNYFSKDETSAILKRLAKMHALVIATRRLQPEKYAEKVGPHLHTIYNDSFIETLIEIGDKFADKLLIAFPYMSRSVYTAITKNLNHCKEFVKNTARAIDTPYTTIYHRDLWSKNIMIKRDGKQEQRIEVKILDFQSYDYESFAFDLVFFLLINVRVEDLTTHFETFIKYYHMEFLKTMQFVNCPVDDYTYNSMWNEIKEKASLNLFNLYLYLAQDQIQSAKINTKSEDKGVDFYLAQPTPTIILNRWECINDIYIENGFI